MGATDLLDLNDSEILRLEKVTAILNQRMGKSLNLEHFRREAIERFAEVGFKVDVYVYDTNVAGVFAFDMNILDRYEGDFDADRQVHEVTNDLLKLGEGGVIKTEMSSSGLILPGKHNHKH